MKYFFLILFEYSYLLVLCAYVCDPGYNEHVITKRLSRENC